MERSRSAPAGPNTADSSRGAEAGVGTKPRGLRVSSPMRCSPWRKAHIPRDKCVQEQHTPPLGDKFVCRHSPEINTQEGKHPSHTPVRTRSTCKHPPHGCACPDGVVQLSQAGVRRLPDQHQTWFCARKSCVGLCSAPKSGDAQGERTGGVWCRLQVELAAAFKDAQSIFLLRPQSAVTPQGFACLEDAVILRL